MAEREPPDTTNIIQMHGVSKRFGEVVALDDVDFHLRRNEIIHADQVHSRCSSTG